MYELWNGFEYKVESISVDKADGASEVGIRAGAGPPGEADGASEVGARAGAGPPGEAARADGGRGVGVAGGRGGRGVGGWQTAGAGSPHGRGGPVRA
jgi:hypothetical protein